MLSKFKIKQVEGKPVQELNDRDLKYALTMAKIKAGA